MVAREVIRRMSRTARDSHTGGATTERRWRQEELMKTWVEGTLYVAASIAVIIEWDRDENQLELHVPSAIQLVAENDVAIQAIPADGRPSF